MPARSVTDIQAAERLFEATFRVLADAGLTYYFVTVFLEKEREMERLEACILLGFLAVFAWIDCRKKELPLSLLGVCGVVGIVFSRLIFDRTWSVILGGACVGGFILLCSLVMKESVGFADGILFCALGTYTGMWQTLLLLFGATALCGLAGGFLLLTKKCTRKESLAFAPFVLAAFVGEMILC